MAASLCLHPRLQVGQQAGRTTPPRTSRGQTAEDKHEAHHGGCLNAIETCAVGHAEVKLDGDVMKVWFVGGENQTDKAVRVSDKQIVLAVTPAGGQEKTLTLDPKPNELAEEKVGDCSYFEGKAGWLAGVKKFSGHRQGQSHRQGAADQDRVSRRI